MVDRAPVPDQEVNRLRALIVGLFAIVLVTQAAAAAFGSNPSSASKTKTTHAATGKKGARAASRALTIDQQLTRKLRELRRYRGTVRFYQLHPRLLKEGLKQGNARVTLRDARRRLVRLTPAIASLRHAIARTAAHRFAALPPRRAICAVFGSDCRAAVAVAWCESRLSTTAENGQYLGLFQMGATARRLYGHGPTAHEQAIAAHRYYVDSGRDWSPWSCRWAAS